MQRTIIDFPCSLFGAVTRDWHLDVRGQAASESVTGNGQVVYGSKPRWVATLEIGLIKRERILTWQAIQAKMRGRVNLLRICVCDPYQPEVFQLDADLIASGIPHSDESLFADDAGYSQSPAIAGVAAAIGATSITVDATPIDDALEPGQFFSVNDWLYRVCGMSGTAASRTYEFEPPLRAAMTTADSIELNPKVIVTFDDDSVGRAKLTSGGRIGSASLSVTEWVNR